MNPAPSKCPSVYKNPNLNAALLELSIESSPSRILTDIINSVPGLSDNLIGASLLGIIIPLAGFGYKKELSSAQYCEVRYPISVQGVSQDITEGSAFVDTRA
jgi:hypothetical protein